MADFFNYTLRCMCYYQGVQLSPLGFAACQSKNCTNKTKGTYCSVGALETSAPP